MSECVQYSESIVKLDDAAQARPTLTWMFPGLTQADHADVDDSWPYTGWPC
jgi:hypothetical protein